MTSGGNPRISITIPVFNGMPYIRTAVRSVLDQMHESDELIVIDNASTDGTTDFLASVTDARVRIITRRTTQSVADNWTQAVRETRGNFVKLMCGDDLIEPDCLARQSAALEDDPAVAMVAGLRTIVDDRDDVLIRRHGLNGLPTRMLGADAVKRCLVAGTNLLGEPAAVMFRGADIRKAMPWENRWPYMLDMATYARIAISGDVALIHEPVARFRVSPSSWSAQILAQQPRDFRGWRDWQGSQAPTRLGPIDRIRSEVALRLRTFGRTIYFRRVAKRAARG